ncbi:hypothetical protein M0805_009025 [Coniferiporia weirii]|nr:hypothetical protein M0805_009025 [Coniferiporia weirii]
MSLQHFGKATLRVAKNYTKGYSDVQTKVRDATSNDPWGPTGQQMNEIAQMTFNQNDFVEIMEMLDKRLNDKGKNWRHVFKALTVLDYLLHNGSENVIIYFRDNAYIVKTLKEFQYVDEYSKDQGANVRQKAKDITNLLQDESRLRDERRNRASMRDRMTRGNNGVADDVEDENARRRTPARPLGERRGNNREDDEIKRAIEESKRSLAVEQAKTAEENDLLRAIKLSEEEQAKRNKSIEESNSRALFDDEAHAAPPSNNPFPLVDPSLQFSQQQLQPQYTAMAPQFTSFNPYQQQAQQEAMQAQYMQQQQEWMHQQQEAQQAQLLQAQQEEWNRQQQLLQFQQQQQQQQQQLAAQQPLYAQPTGFGSNNPFAISSFGQSPPPVASTSSNTSGIDSFSLPSTFAHSPSPSAQSPVSVSPAPPPAMARPVRSDGEHAHLASILANRGDDGVDTFGNIGQLRYGHTQAGRMAAQKTGQHNPFAAQQQTSEQPFFTI